MKTEIQRRIENLVTDNRGYLKIPMFRLFGDKRALDKWLEFSIDRKDVEKTINGYPRIYKDFKKEFWFPLSYILPNKLYVKNDEISYLDYSLIDSGLKIIKAISIFSMIQKKDFDFFIPELINKRIYDGVKF